MATTATGLFRTPGDAQRAILALLAQGVERTRIGLIASDPNAAHPHGSQYDEQRGRHSGLVLGAELGGATGLLLGLATAAIPGLGVVLLAGPIVGLLAGVGFGAAVGEAMGSMNESGVPFEEASVFSEGIRAGKTVITVSEVEDRLPEVIRIMRENGATDTSTTAMKIDAVRKHGLPENRAATAGPTHLSGAGQDSRTDATTDEAVFDFGATPDIESELDYNRTR